MKYEVYFEIFGKKMKTTIEANNPKDAEYLVRGKIIFHKVEIKDDIINHFGSIFGFNK